jgi:serine/threonine protein kinase
VPILPGASSVAGGRDDRLLREIRNLDRSRLHDPSQSESAEKWANRLASLCAAQEIAANGDSTDHVFPPKSSEPLLGVIGQYELLAKIGCGGMGEVYKARHRLMSRIVALKVIQDRRLDDPQAILRFRREIRSLARLDHPNIVRAYHADLDGETHFLVMEYVQGMNLAEMVAARGPLSIPQACSFIHQAAAGLQHAHEQGLVHRDLKPSNIVVTPEGKVKLLDLGLALGRTQYSSTPAGAPSGVVLGSPDYMAPEQWLDSQTVDIRADIYSLGCTLYHLLAGRPPFAAPAYETTEAKMHAHAVAPPRSLEELRPHVPRGLLVIIDRLLAKAPAGRFANPAQVQEALAPFAEGDAARGDGARISRQRLLAACAASLAILTILFAWHPSLTFDKGPIEITSVYRHFGPWPDQEPMGVLDSSACEKDRVGIQIRFNKPVYASIIALDTNGEVQVCYEQSDVKTPVSEIDWPKTFGLTDGPGMQGFLVLSTEKPQPSYQEWQQKIRGSLPWRHCEGKWVWQADSKGIRRLHVHRGDVLDLPKPPETVQELYGFLRHCPDIHAFELLVFPVQERADMIKATR